MLKPKRLLLIQPPVEDFYATPFRAYPLGLIYVAAAPIRAGHEVVLLDAFRQGGSRTIPVPVKFKSLEEFYKPGDRSPWRLFGHYRHFGLSFDEIGERAFALKPDLIGVSTLFTAYHSTAMKVVEAVKARLPEVPVVMGGGHVTLCGEPSPLVHGVVRGPGEEGLMEFLGSPSTGEVFLPARSLLNPGDYLYRGKPMTFVLSSRGCPNRCTFCTGHTVFPGYAHRSAGEVLAEIRSCAADFGITHFDFEDDNFGADPDETPKLLRGLSELGIPGLSYSAMNGICADRLDGERLSLMREAGFTGIELALVSADPGVCGSLGRPFDPERLEQTVRAAQQAGFPVTAYLILGLPGETPSSMLRGMKFLFDLGVRIGPSFCYAVPGTPLYDDCRRNGFLGSPDPDFCRLTALNITTPDFGQRELMTLFYAARILNLLIGIGEEEPVVRALLRELWRERKVLRIFRKGAETAPVSEQVLEGFFSLFGESLRRL